VAAIDALEASGFGPRFVLIGLCSGGYWAFNVALDDDRVGAAVVLNPKALIWDVGLSARRTARIARTALKTATWRRFLRGEIPMRRIATVARAVATRAAHAAWAVPTRRLRPDGAAPGSIDGLLDRLRRRNVAVVLAFSNDELLRTELEEQGLPARMRQWPNAAWVQLPGRDHTVRPIVAQVAVHELLDRALQDEVDRVVQVGAPSAAWSSPRASG
jgi:hypothetical protein